MYAAIWMVIDMTWLVAGAVVAHAWTSKTLVSWSGWELTLTRAGSLQLLLAFVLAGVYARRRRKRPASTVAYITLITIVAWVVADHAMLAMRIDKAAALDWLDAWLITSLLLMIVSRLFCGEWIHRMERVRPHVRRVVVAGDASYLEQWLQTGHEKSDDYLITATYVPGSGKHRLASDGVPALKDFESLLTMARDQCFDELWLALSMSKQEEIRRYVTALQHHFIDIRLFSDVQELPLFNPSATTRAGATFIDLVTSPSHKDDVWLKPVFDRFFALVVLLALSPLLLAIAALVKCTSSGPVFFRQRRKGVDGREFTILKFRSMHVHNEASGTLTQASKNDKRVTSIGRFLRKTSLDELPQFINVLFGQMSVVGPRPHALEHDDFYMRLIDGYMYRYRIKPGITGWAQINGARGETTKVESMARRVTLDLFYIQNWSFWLDLKIVTMTVVKGFSGKNVY